VTHPEGRSEAEEPVTVTDKRRIDPQTGEVREGPGPAPGGPAAGAFAGETPEEADKAAELLADLQRVQADFANYRKRALRDHEVAAERGKAMVVGSLLGVLDDLDRARSLADFGAEGEVFDPALHEAVQHEGDGSNPVIGTVMRKGYRLGEQVLRHALVGVVDATGAGENAESDQ